MMQRGLVSVVTPVYNGANYISRLLRSILRQTYPHIEMILVDDGSVDATIAAAEKYIAPFQEKGYTLQIISAPHKNASAAINQGLGHIKGEYLVWPDSDDELHPDSIEVRVRFLEAHPEYACVRSVMEYVSNETGAILHPAEQLGDLVKEEIFWDVLDGRSFVCCGCYMLKTESFFQIYPSKEIPEYDVGQNFQMLLPLLFRHRCPTIPQKLYRVYVRSDSHSRRSRSKTEDYERMRCFEQLVDEIVQICGIEGTQDMERIRIWKLLRRKDFAYRHHLCVHRIGYKLMIAYIRRKLPRQLNNA